MGSGCVVRWREVSGEESQCVLERADPVRLGAAAPWREFRSHRGQAHFPGWYWCATTGGHVVYESRLELARLLIADFDPCVARIVAQPFLVIGEGGGRVRRHVPDFLLLDGAGAVTVVNVKPAALLGEAVVAEALAWAGEVFAGRGWVHEVWSGASSRWLENVRFVAGYRFADRVDPRAVDAVRSLVAASGPMRIRQVEAALRGPGLGVRPALLHLVWRRELLADLQERLDVDTLVQAAR